MLQVVVHQDLSLLIQKIHIGFPASVLDWSIRQNVCGFHSFICPSLIHRAFSSVLVLAFKKTILTSAIFVCVLVVDLLPCAMYIWRARSCICAVMICRTKSGTSSSLDSIFSLGTFYCVKDFRFNNKWLLHVGSVHNRKLIYFNYVFWVFLKKIPTSSTHWCGLILLQLRGKETLRS